MNRPRIYACYSPSHTPLVEKHFLPSIPNGFDVVLRKIPQSCPDGSYNTPGWNLTMSDKVDLILSALETEKQPFILSDVDVRFYDLQPQELEALVPSPHKIAYQLNVPLERSAGKPKYCAGFAIMRPDPAVWALYRQVRTLLNHTPTEQSALYATLAEAPSDLATYLPPERFWSLVHGPLGKDLYNTKGRNLAIHHASWIEGVNAKLERLDAMLRSH